MRYVITYLMQMLSKGNEGVQEYHDFLVRTKIQTFRISVTKLRMCSQTHWNEKVQRTLKSDVQCTTLYMNCLTTKSGSEETIFHYCDQLSKKYYTLTQEPLFLSFDSSPVNSISIKSSKFGLVTIYQSLNKGSTKNSLIQ